MTDQIVTFKTPFINLTFFSLLDIKIYTIIHNKYFKRKYNINFGIFFTWL